MNDWISVEERLPDNTKGVELVLVAVSGWPQVRGACCVDGLWVDLLDRSIVPTHWMPLPDPPVQDTTSSEQEEDDDEQGTGD